MAITDYHQRIFTFLENYRKAHPEADFTYLLRQKNIKGRSRNSYYFTGNDSYIHIGLYQPISNNNKTRSIGLNFRYDPATDAIDSCSLRIVFDDSHLQAQAPIYESIIHQINSDEFKQYHNNRYTLYYQAPDWETSLQTYLDEQRPIIEKVLREAGVYDSFHIPQQELEHAIQEIEQMAASPKSTDAAYWIFQGNPNFYQITDALQHNAIHTWRTPQYASEIKPGDKVILWITGVEAGCYALAEVVSDVYTGMDEPEEEPYRLNPQESAPTKRVKINIIRNLWNQPIRKNVIQALPGFENFNGSRQGTVLTATRQQYETLNQLPIQQTPMSRPYNDAKNIILYGPPGTGKTYGTIGLAVKIIDGQALDSHTANKQRFDALRKAEQIEFITFHQSYTYEDFVVGIRPDTDGQSLTFQRSYGIFYRIAKRARENYDASREKAFQGMLHDFLQYIKNSKENVIDFNHIGDAILGDWNDETIDLQSQKDKSRKTLSTSNLYSVFTNGHPPKEEELSPYYEALVNELRNFDRSNHKRESRDLVALQNYVLIIDEINRANMSRVFGELITLLEDDKRLGAENALTVTLPTGEAFAVPPNLYLIGTMNTADKSLALLDIALRRRFEFIYQSPIYSHTLLEPSIGRTLEALNNAIRKEHKSADYLIGHAYFIGKSTEQLATIFNNRVIPLLMEYFNGNVNTVKKVLEKASIIVRVDEITDQLTFEAWKNNSLS